MITYAKISFIPLIIYPPCNNTVMEETAQNNHHRYLEREYSTPFNNYKLWYHSLFCNEKEKSCIITSKKYTIFENQRNHNINYAYNYTITIPLFIKTLKRKYNFKNN